MLTEIFTALNISEDETKTYSVLLEIGGGTVSALAKHLGKPRPSLYGFLSRLHEKGLVTHTTKGGVKLFVAEPPAKITLLFQERIDILREQQKRYERLLPELAHVSPTVFLHPTFHLYEGDKGLQHVLKDMLLYQDIKTCAFWPIKAMVDVLSPAFFRYHNRERIKNNIWTRAIWPKRQTVDMHSHPYLGVGSEFKREIRIAPKEIDCSMGYWIYINKVAFIASRKESFGFIIESRELVEMLMAQFEVIWRLSEPVTISPHETKIFLKDL